MTRPTQASTRTAWETALSHTTEDGIRIRGYAIDDLIGRVPFSSVVYLLYTGELPDAAKAGLIDALMVASIDHGAGAPSALAARTAISGGAGLGAGAAAGLLTLGRFHGAAVEDSMDALVSVDERVRSGESLAAAADAVIEERKAQGRRLSGFGHRQHKRRDPRLTRLFSLASDAGVDGRYLAAAEAIEAGLKRALGRELPINIDGAMAAILAEIGFPANLSNALFIASRLAGILAHAGEELTSMPPMRRIDPVDHGYCGPPPRPLPEKT